MTFDLDRTPAERTEPDVPASVPQFDLPAGGFSRANDVGWLATLDTMKKEFPSAQDLLNTGSTSGEKDAGTKPDGLDKYKSALVLASAKPELKDGENVVKGAKVNYNEKGKEVTIDLPKSEGQKYLLQVSNAKPYFDKEGNLCVEGTIAKNKEGTIWKNSGGVETLYGKGTLRIKEGKLEPQAQIWLPDSKGDLQLKTTLSIPKAR
jgi:hypothetical protein